MKMKMMILGLAIVMVTGANAESFEKKLAGCSKYVNNLQVAQMLGKSITQQTARNSLRAIRYYCKDTDPRWIPWAEKLAR